MTVALLDQGVNAKLADLAGVVLAGKNLIDGSRDGRVDTDTDKGGHGTAMAALIAGQGGGTRMAGVAPESRILPLVVAGDTGTEADAIHYAVDHGAKVISMSFGSAAANSRSCSRTMQEAVDYALFHEVVLVAAAGNSGNEVNTPEEPASCPGVLAVGAVNYQFKPWVKSQRQPYVSVAAPGVDVGSIGKNGVFAPNTSGTSQATALTSAAVALVRSKFPQMSAREVVQRIIHSARDVGPPGRDDQTGYGLIRPYHALIDQVPKNAPNPVFAAWDKTRSTQSPAAAPRSNVPPPESGNGSRTITYILAGVGGLAVVGAAVAIPLVLSRRRRRLGAAPASYQRPPW